MGPHSSGLGPHVPLPEYKDNMKKIAVHLKVLSSLKYDHQTTFRKQRYILFKAFILYIDSAIVMRFMPYLRALHCPQ